MRISDWSSDVCSSDLAPVNLEQSRVLRVNRRGPVQQVAGRLAVAEGKGDACFVHQGLNMRPVLQHAVEDGFRLVKPAQSQQRLAARHKEIPLQRAVGLELLVDAGHHGVELLLAELDRKSTRLNSSH